MVMLAQAVAAGKEEEDAAGEEKGKAGKTKPDESASAPSAGTKPMSVLPVTATERGIEEDCPSYRDFYL